MDKEETVEVEEEVVKVEEIVEVDRSVSREGFGS